MDKKYKNGFYGGKFMPFHLGHLHCLEIAAQECEVVHLILFYGGDQEVEIAKNDKRDFLSIDARVKKIIEIGKKFSNVAIHVIDITQCRTPDGKEDWDAETPLVLNCTGPVDAVYGSEPSYADYFKRAYPYATYRCIDPERKEVPISATKIRNMTNEEMKKWIV